jgi:hypothetical protein
MCEEQSALLIEVHKQSLQDFDHMPLYHFTRGELFHDRPVKVWGTAPTRRIGARKSQVERVGAVVNNARRGPMKLGSSQSPYALLPWLIDRV